MGALIDAKAGQEVLLCTIRLVDFVTGQEVKGPGGRSGTVAIDGPGKCTVALTKESGRFEFADISPGWYAVGVSSTPGAGQKPKDVTLLRKGGQIGFYVETGMTVDAGSLTREKK